MTNFKKTLAVVALVGGLVLGSAPKAHAATMADLQAMIASLQAQLAAMSGNTTTTTCTYTYSGVLKVGSKGASVMAMQAIVGANADGNFGPMTKAKVMAFQASHGLTADGVVGPKSGAALAGACTTTSTTTTTTTTGGNGNITLSGGAGNLQSVTLLGSPANTQVGEGMSDVKVMGAELRADSGSDLKVSNLRLTFHATGSGSTWVSRYIQNASVWYNGQKVGSVDVASLSQNGTTYTASVPLNGVVVRANQVADLYVAVSANGSIDSNDASETLNVQLDNIRVQDASGAILTGSFSVNQDMTFLKLSSSASVKLTVSEDSSNPKDRTVTTNYTSTTNDVPLLKFNMTAAGSDMIINKIDLPATEAGTSNVSDISAYYKLKYNGNIVSSFTVGSSTTGTTTTIAFGDSSYNSATAGVSTSLNGGVGQIVIPAGSTGNFEIDADVKAMATGTGNGSAFDAGDTLKVDFPSATLQSSAVGVQDQTGASLGTTSTNRTGSATGYNATFRIEGLSSTLASSQLASTVNTSSGALTSEQYIVRVNVTAVGNDFFLPTSAAFVAGANNTTVPALGSPTAGISFVISNGSGYYVTGGATAGQLDSTATTGNISTSVDTSGLNIDGASGRIKVSSGTTVTIPFTVTISENGTSSNASGQYKVGVLSMNGANSGSGSLTAFATTPVTSFQTQFNTPAFQ